MFNLQKNLVLVVLIIGIGCIYDINAQDSQPTQSPTPIRPQLSKKNKKRISGVKITENTAQVSERGVETAVPAGNEKQEVILTPDKSVKTESDKDDRIKAGEAALEREKAKIKAEAEAIAKIELEKRESELNLMMEIQRRAKDAEFAKFKENAEAENKLRIEAEDAKRLKAESDSLAEMKRLEDEKLLKDAQLVELNIKLEGEIKAKADAEALVIAAQKLASEIEAKRLETDRIAKELEIKEKFEKRFLRNQLIEASAKKLGFLKPLEALSLVNENISSGEEITEILKKAAKTNPRLVKAVTFCDSEFQGEGFTMDLTGSITMRSFLERLRYYYQINFLPDSEILELPVQVNVENVPWNYVLRSQLNFLDLEAKCSDGNTIAILKRNKLQTLNENVRKTSPLRTEFIKLKYLQATVGGTVNVAGRGSGGANIIDSLEATLNKTIKADGDNRGSISRIPGRNEFIITATDEQLTQIKQVIARADKPSYQVVIYSSILTANENKLRDIGGQLNVVGGTADLGFLGGLLGIGSSGSATTTATTGSPISGLQPPGGVPKLGPGFSAPPSGGSGLGFSNLFGTVQLSAQLSLLSQKGAVKIDNRPFVAVLDGQNTDLQIGRVISVPIASNNNFGSGGGQLEVLNAGNTLNVTPNVIEDENGNPVAVTLQVRIESNDVDTTVVSQGVPSIIRRSTQTSLMLNANQTAIIGGFSTDSETDSESKTPGLGDIPLLGGLFKRKIKTKNSDRLYFTIRVAIISQGEVLTTIPLVVDTTPQLPNPNNDFFKPFNQNVIQTSSPNVTPTKPI